jgi:hypothetical protein
MKKKSLMFIAMILLSLQYDYYKNKVYLLFEFMKVDNEQEMLIWIQKILEKHDQRVKNGDIIGVGFMVIATCWRKMRLISLLRFV